MLDRHTATVRLARQMVSAERSISDALVETTALLHTAALAQHDVEAPFALTQQPLLRMQKMLDGVITARGAAAQTHAGLLEVSREVMGPETPEDCPDLGRTSGELTLRAA